MLSNRNKENISHKDNLKTEMNWLGGKSLQLSAPTKFTHAATIFTRKICCLSSCVYFNICIKSFNMKCSFTGNELPKRSDVQLKKANKF